MSTTPSTITLKHARTPARRIDMSRWLREPLLHFIALGALLFAVDHLIHSRADDPHTIVVGPEVESEARELFETSRGRQPNQDELKALTAVWLDNEVLYREGLALQVDKGDTAIRERVIFKALSVVDANVRLPPIDENGLREWFENHRLKYDEPPRYDFEEAALSGDTSEPAVRDFVKTLNTGTPGDTHAGLRVFKGRPLANLVQSYGPDFPAALGDTPSTEWRALPTKDGWRAMRLDALSRAKPADFDALHGVVLQDWKDAVASEQRSAAVRELAKKYRVKFEPSTGTPEP